MSRKSVVAGMILAVAPGAALAAYLSVEKEAVAPEPTMAIQLPEMPAPLDLRNLDEPASIEVTEPPVRLEIPSRLPAPAAREVKASAMTAGKPEPALVEAPLQETDRERKVEVREVLAGKSTRQSRTSSVRMWGVHATDTAVPSDDERRSPSELRRRYRSADDEVTFESINVPAGRE